MTDAALKDSADRCASCYGDCGPEICETVKARGGCKVAASKRLNCAALDTLMGIFKAMKMEVVDVTPKRKGKRK